jgi:peptidoglycan glycosyltransferase
MELIKNKTKELAATKEPDHYERKTTAELRKPIYNIIYIFIGLFVLMAGYFSYYIMVRSDEVINNAYNKRQEVLSERFVRGQILSADKEILAQTLVDADGKETRVYPFGKVFAHVVGRNSKGTTGIEESENIRLLTSNINSIEVMYSDLIGEKSPGDNVVTTLDSKLQQVAYDALGDYRGAAVVMEATTGRILAMVSTPAYDPNKVDEEWEKLLEDEDTKKAPLFNRATQGKYPPGSTFKLVTALEYMRENLTYLEYEYDCDGSIEYEGMTIHCHSNKRHGELDLPMAIAKSCNTSFANIGKGIDIEKFYNLCEELLFNQNLPVNMASSVSSFALKKGKSGTKEAMQTAIGQGNTLISPLHNAMITASVANGGVMMKPYVVDHIENAQGATIKKYSSQTIGRMMSGEEADYLADAMRLVVTEGTATKLKDLKVEVAGKTGSADNPAGRAHSWFVGFAPYEDTEVVVSIIVENVGTGSEYAVPIARKIFKEYSK